MFTHFYHSTIRKYVVAFGTLFNNIKIEKPGEDGSLAKTHVRVPLSYAPKETYVRILQENFSILISGDDQGRQQWAGFLPRMCFEIANITYDPTRKRNTMSKNVMYDATSTGKLSYTYSEIPYNIEFNLSIMTRKIDDGLQIVEQIIPYFAPEFVVTLNLGEFAPKVDIPITLNSVNQTVEYEGEGDAVNVRVVTWDLVFTLRGYVYGPVKNSSIIKTAIAEFFNRGTDYRLETVRADALDPDSPDEPPFTLATDPNDYKTNIRIFGESATDNDIFDPNG